MYSITVPAHIHDEAARKKVNVGLVIRQRLNAFLSAPRTLPAPRTPWKGNQRTVYVAGAERERLIRVASEQGVAPTALLRSVLEIDMPASAQEPAPMRTVTELNAQAVIQLPISMLDATPAELRRGLRLLEQAYPHGLPWDTVDARERSVTKRWAVPAHWARRYRTGVLSSRVITTAALAMARASAPHLRTVGET